jgi:hypothetical protein
MAVEMRDVLKPASSARLSPDVAATVKRVTTKAGNIEIDRHPS